MSACSSTGVLSTGMTVSEPQAESMAVMKKMRRIFLKIIKWVLYWDDVVVGSSQKKEKRLVDSAVFILCGGAYLVLVVVLTVVVIIVGAEPVCFQLFTHFGVVYVSEASFFLIAFSG